MYPVCFNAKPFKAKLFSRVLNAERYLQPYKSSVFVENVIKRGGVSLYTHTHTQTSGFHRNRRILI